MRVLWLSPWLRPIARVCAENLQSLGAEVMLVTANLHPEAEQIRDYETVLLGRPVPTADWIRIAKTYQKARQFKPDVVVTELLRDPRWRVFGNLAPRICLVHDDKPHDETHVEPWWIRSFDPWNARADAMIAFSEYVATRVRAHTASSPPVHVAPLVTDLERSLVPEFVPASRRKDFLLVGRQRPYKNHGIVFAAWDAHTRSAEWRGDELVLLGRGEIAERLPRHTRWHRSDFRYSQVVGQMASAKGSVVHARSASQSGVQIMSMQLGVAPVVSSAGGLPEYQPPGLSVTDIDDVEGVLQAFNALANPVQAEVQGQVALEHYNDNYDPKLAMKRFLDIFNEVAGGRLKR